MHTLHGYALRILSNSSKSNLESIMQANRSYANTEEFFSPALSGLHDPYLMPDMDKAVARILTAREARERIVIFGDYDVDGVSSTAILVRFLTEIGCEVSYRLPHRVHDGYGLKSYFFDELATK
jgi:single-stranded-DNA-specific exonuclease